MILIRKWKINDTKREIRNILKQYINYAKTKK